MLILLLMGPAPGTFELSGHFEVKIRNGSGIRDPQIENTRIETVRTDRSHSSYEEFTWLAETRLAQNALNK